MLHSTTVRPQKEAKEAKEVSIMSVLYIWAIRVEQSVQRNRLAWLTIAVLYLLGASLLLSVGEGCDDWKKGPPERRHGRF